MIAIDETQRVLVVAAHPDDETIGCGGTLARFRDATAQVRIVCVAEGITARFDPPHFESDEVQTKISRRSTNALKALEILGVPPADVLLGDRYCCRLDTVPHIDVVKEIEKHIRAFRPTVVLTHSDQDTNIDHRIIHKAVLTALRPIEFPYVTTLLAFEVASSTECDPLHPFAANVFVDITSSIDRKMAALAAYEDESPPAPHPRSTESVAALARFRGSQSGRQYAEAFRCIRVMIA